MRNPLQFLSVLLVLLAISILPGYAHEKHGIAAAAQDVSQVLEQYKAGMEALSVERLDLIMDPDLLVLEHGGKDVGWAEYRNHHIAEHMKEWKSLRVTDAKVLESSVSGDWAYAAQESVNTIVTAKDGKTMVLAVTETFVLKKHSDGWKIKHLHVSLKKKS